MSAALPSALSWQRTALGPNHLPRYLLGLLWLKDPSYRAS